MPIGVALDFADRIRETPTVNTKKRVVQISLFRWASWRCERCGSREHLTRDHVVPKSMGGSDTLINKQVLCDGCNQLKADTIQVYTKRQRVRNYARNFGWRRNSL